jgi:hypothetical protein
MNPSDDEDEEEEKKPTQIQNIKAGSGEFKDRRFRESECHHFK